MNIENKILIHSLEHGYVVTDYISGKKYAVESPESVLKIVGKALGMTEQLPATEEDVLPVTESIQEPVPNILKQDIMIPRFQYDHSLRKWIPDYKNAWYAELPDGRVALGYWESSYYTTKENVIKIPYPVPYRYFKGSGISTTAQTCLRAYHQVLENPEELTEDKTAPYVSKSTQDRIREDAERKADHKRKMDNCKCQTEMSEKTKKLREMTIKMGIQ